MVDDPIVVAILDGKVIKILLEDEDDFILNFLNRTYLDKILVIAILFIFTITVMM